VDIEIPQPGRRASRQIAVWETTPWWGPQLQHRFANRDAAVRECRQLQDVLSTAPEVAVVAAGVPESIQGIAELCRTAGKAFIVAVVSKALRAAEWRLRELGADVVVGEEVGADALAAICRRALATVREES
jgi:DNA-binding NarL/FixJ family response regulator